MLIEVVLVADHDKAVVSPATIDAGAAVKVIVGGTWFTVIVTWAVVVPPGPVAVAVYVVVLVGAICAWPLSGSDVWSSPRTLGAMVSVSACAEVHVSVASWPFWIVVGLVASVTVGFVLGGVLTGVPTPLQPTVIAATDTQSM